MVPDTRHTCISLVSYVNLVSKSRLLNVRFSEFAGNLSNVETRTIACLTTAQSPASCQGI